MLTVILIWLYVLATTYLIGFCFLNVMSDMSCMIISTSKGHTRKYQYHYQESYIITGVAIVTVFSEIISLFTRVGLGANIFLILLCAVIAVYYRDELRENLFGHAFSLRAHYNWIFYLLIFLLMAYGTSHGIMHYDSDLYHAQAIHWIEDYGIIKGLGNLHVRLAYNSAAFPLSALYSFSFLGGQSYHVMAGFFALLLAWQCFDIKNILRRGHLIISDFARVAAIYYLFTIFDEMVAPASDYFLSTIVFYIIIHLLDMYVRHEKSYVPYIEMALLSIFAVTIKLSAAPMVLLSIIPIYMLFHKRSKEKMKAFGVAVVLALIITIPFLVRNVIISGWILYPVTIFDFFGFSWEIPKGVAEFDSLEIRTFGRGYNDVAQYGNVALYEWVPNWFESLSLFNKAMIVLSLLAIVIYAAYLVYFCALFATRKEHGIIKLKNNKIFDLSHRSMLSMADFITMGGTLIACMAFWFFSAPLIRYGVVYVWLTVATIFGRMIIILLNRSTVKVKEIAVKVFVALFAIWIVYKGANLFIEDIPRFNPAYLVKQQDYGTYDVESFKLGNETVYYPTEGDRIGYYPFPGATHDLTGEVELYGSDFEKGIKSLGN